MLATFATFAVASRRFFPRHVYGLRTQLPLRPTRQPTRSFLVASILQQHLSCIRPQRLYKPALRPPLLDKADSIRLSQLNISIDCSRSQSLPQNLDMVASPRFPWKTPTYTATTLYKVLQLFRAFAHTTAFRLQCTKILFLINFKNVFISISLNVLNIELKKDSDTDESENFNVDV